MNLAAVRVPVSTLWTSPEAPREVDAPAVAAVPDAGAWCDAMDDDTRLGLHGRTLSQLLLGEPVLIRSERDGWAEVVAPWQPSISDETGYPGWLPAAHLGDLPLAASDPVSVRVPVTTLYAEPGAGPVAEVSFGTVLASTERTGGHVRVALPDGEDGWLSEDAVRVSGDGTPDERLRLAGQFLGLRYLWAGTSSYGLDCSGLVHAVFRVLGMRVPRDASDQQAGLPAVEVDEVMPGDLYFFARPGETAHHVGIVTGAYRMIHASEARAIVEEPLDQRRLATLSGAGRVR
jgi:gamma-D-glutamyl-L-lysine dipeptidyl-peptidase